MTLDKQTLDELRIEREPEAKGPTWKWILVLVVIVALAPLAWWLLGTSTVTEVRTAVAREFQTSEARTSLNASGYVTARRQATVSSKVTGRVTEVLIEEGMRVEEGQILARLDDSNVRARYRLAEAQLTSKKTALRETDALLVEARLNFERNKQLAKKGVASQAELDRIRAETRSLEARLDRQRAEIEVARRQVEIWKQQLEDTVIRAPFAGIVVAKNAQPGEMISPISAGGGFTRTGIGTIVDMSSLEIEVDVNEGYLNRVTQGQRVVATLDAYPEWQIPCHVIAIIPTADRQRATVEVRVGFEELDDRILPDMGVKAAFQESEEERSRISAIVVPHSAVRHQEGQDIVLVVHNGRVEHRAVKVHETRDGKVLLAAGLAAGESVVIEGPADLSDGEHVKETRR